MGTVLARLTGVSAGYADRAVLHDITLDVHTGRRLVVLGPSGAGKSTLLRLLTRELQPLDGTVEFTDGPAPREGVVRQDPLLFEWLTVAENIDFGVRLVANHDVDHARPAEVLDRLGLTDVADSYPDSISGGQAQRASLARALAISPSLLLLDEPFSALDPATRADLQHWLLDVTSDHELTTVLVTHSLDEALVLADDIVLIDRYGRIAHTWRNDAPAADETSALIHPLRAALRAAYESGPGLEEGDEEFSGLAAAGGGRR